MCTQIMGSQGGVGDPAVSKPISLSRQGSLYSLTLDEVQNQLANVGKPLSSMNLDELLRNVWTVEANQSVGGSNADNGPQSIVQDAPGSSLNRQSSFSLSRDLSRKTVDEVLREIQLGKKSGTSNSSLEWNPERQDTLGEMTLEDFLVQAGVALDAAGGRENSNNNGNIGHDNSGILESDNERHNPNVVEHAQWMQYPILPQQPQQSMMAMFMPGHHRGGAISDPSYPEAQMAISSSPLMVPLCDPQTAGRKRVAPGVVVEKTVERRQKRMIKNRESAARSRARKQAYTNELENKVSRLEEENERLRRMREVEKALPSAPPPQPKYQLRRTSSATF